MTRILKLYKFPFKATKYGANSRVPAANVAFSGYPGTLASIGCVGEPISESAGTDCQFAYCC